MANTSKSRSNITKAFCGLPLLMLFWSCNQIPAKKQPEQEAATPAATGTKDSTALHPQQSDIRPGQKLVMGQVYKTPSSSGNMMTMVITIYCQGKRTAMKQALFTTGIRTAILLIAETS